MKKPEKHRRPIPKPAPATRIDLYHHFPDGGATQPDLTKILALLQTIQQQGAQIMSKADDITAKLNEIDTETNEIAADIDKLIAGGLTGLSEAEAQAVIDRLTAKSEELKSIAAKA